MLGDPTSTCSAGASTFSRCASTRDDGASTRSDKNARIHDGAHKVRFGASRLLRRQLRGAKTGSENGDIRERKRGHPRLSRRLLTAHVKSADVRIYVSGCPHLCLHVKSADVPIYVFGP